MKEFSNKAINTETASSVIAMKAGQNEARYAAYIGLDVHKETISVAIAASGRGAPDFYGTVPSTPEALTQLARRLAEDPTKVSFCYEAGPCGYGIYRQLQTMGYACMVVAPALIPRKPGERLKTDRRDAVQLARLHRSGDLNRL